MTKTQEYYNELRDKGYDHYEASDLIDKSERTLYRYKADYVETYDSGMYIEEPDEQIEDYDSKNELKLLIQRKQLNELRKEVNQMTTDKARIQMFEQIVRDTITSHSHHRINFSRRNRLVDLNTIPMYTIADAHYGANEDSVNSDMIHNRLVRAFYEIAEDINLNDYEDVKIAILGDLLDGIIHQSQLIKGTMNLIEQALGMKEILIQGLEYILDNTGVLIELLFVTDSNHSQIRLGNGKSNTDWKDQNLEILLAEFVEQYFDDDDRIVITSGYQIEKTYFGNRYRFTHGYRDVKKLNPTTIQNLTMRNDPSLDFIICGHFHNFQSIAIGYDPSTNVERRLISVPSIVGQNDFANSIGCRNNAGILKLVIGENGIHAYKHIQLIDEEF